jgi:hypothetical protein
MEECEKKFECGCERKNINKQYGHESNVVYVMGMLGAAIFYISNATSFWIGVLGVLKALVWPVFIVYELLSFLMK